MKVTVRDAGAVRILDLHGKLNFGGGDRALQESVQGLLDAGHHKILLNLKNVDWIDTPSVGELVSCKKRTVAKGGDLKLLMPSGTVYRILSMVGLHLVFDIFDDEIKAVDASWEPPRYPA